MLKINLIALTATALILTIALASAAETITPLNEKTKLEILSPPPMVVKEKVGSGCIDIERKIAGDFELSFKLIFRKIKDYTDLQVCLTDKETGSEFTFSFFRGDIEILKKYNSPIKGVRCVVGYLNSNKLRSEETAPVPFDINKEYCFNVLFRKKHYPDMKIYELKNKNLQLMYQEPFEALGDIAFDHVLIKLRPNSDNIIKCTPSGQLLISNKVTDLEIFDFKININSGRMNE